MSNNSQRFRGEGKIGCIFWLLVMGIVALIAVKMVPVKIASAQFYDHMEEQTKFALQAPPEAIKRQIMQKARDLDLPVKPENLSVERTGTEIRIHCTYEVPIEFPGYTYVWKFDERLNRPLYIF